jgi:hypothetical protein
MCIYIHALNVYILNTRINIRIHVEKMRLHSYG